MNKQGGEKQLIHSRSMPCLMPSSFKILGVSAGDSIMVIDKTTGKGCAWSIASRTITKRLIDEGIIGKQFARKPFKNSLHSTIYDT